MYAGRLLLLLLLTLTVLHAQPDARTDAVQRARTGDYTFAIPALEQLAAGGDAAAAADLVAVYTWAGRPADALAAWSRLPSDQRPAWVQADAARALAQLGGGLGAQALAGAPDPDLDARAAAALTRLTNVEEKNPARRFAAADRALAELDRQLAAARAQPRPDEGLIRRLTFDRWVALRARYRMTEIVAEFSRWPEPPTGLPPYALGAVAVALLYLEQPEQARELYREACRRAPDDLDLRLGLFYAEVECENYAGAYALIDALDRAQPATIKYGLDGTLGENPDKLGVSVAAALVRYYADELRVAWPRIEQLAAAAPGNAYLRREAAAVMAARGWPRRARAELARVEAIAPGELANRLARTELLLAGRHYPEVAAEITALEATYPENKVVQRLTRSWALHQSPEFYASYHSETGDSPDLSGTSWRAEAEAWSPPIGYLWRLLAAYTAASAEIPEGKVKMRLPVAGLEWRRGGLDFLAQAGRREAVRDETLLRLRARWAPTDEWSADFAATSNTAEIPLRALHYGITSDTLAASVAWAPHESRRVSIGGQATDFSSGNQRLEWQANWRERIHERPHLDVDLVADTALQTNSLPDEPYYNPARAWDAGAALDVSHILHRRYRTAWVQRFNARLGQRTEQGFGSGGVWSARYELRRDFSDALSLSARYTVGASRYDGAAESFTNWEVTIHGRF